ncbi:MAG: DUF2207 domain-containing protein [Alkalibacterium sp.]|nr:DUF2207 domain-containing protein [Alkalibacterium sp.]
MKVGRKKWVIFLLLSVVYMASPLEVQANTLHEMNVEMELLENGTAIITEQREMTMDEGTELFIVINEEQGLEVIDFHVENMTGLSEWDSDQSRDEKADTYGILDTRDGKELVWGIGDYGRQTYELNYTVSNVVRQLNDGQSMHWNFNTFGDIQPETMTIEITGPFSFSDADTRIWGFGYEGQIELVDGSVYSYTEGAIQSDRPATVLVQFLNDPFLLSYYEDRTLESVLEEAESNASRGGGGDSEFDGRILAAIFGGIALLFGGIIGLIVKIEQSKKEQGKIPTSHEQRKRNKGLYFTDIPYKDGDITDIAFFLKQLQKGSFEHYFFAFLLKWSKDNCLIIEEEKGKKKKQSRLTFLPDTFKRRRENSVDVSDVETQLWDTLIEASDENNQMSSKEMKKWAEKNAEKLSSFEKLILDESKNKLISEGYIIEETLSFLTVRIPFTAITKKGQRTYDQLTQFENHLDAISKDDSLSYRQLIPEESFLMWASLYGKEEEVITQLEQLLPGWDEQEIDYIPYYYTHYYGLHVFSSSMSSGYTSAGYSSSAGFGGATSIGGGGGAIGGGGGGAR